MILQCCFTHLGQLRVLQEGSPCLTQFSVARFGFISYFVQDIIPTRGFTLVISKLNCQIVSKISFTSRLRGWWTPGIGTRKTVSYIVLVSDPPTAWSTPSRCYLSWSILICIFHLWPYQLTTGPTYQLSFVLIYLSKWVGHFSENYLRPQLFKFRLHSRWEQKWHLCPSLTPSR